MSSAAFFFGSLAVTHGQPCRRVLSALALSSPWVVGIGSGMEPRRTGETASDFLRQLQPTQKVPRRGFTVGWVLMGRWRPGAGRWRQFRQWRRAGRPFVCSPERQRVCLHPCDTQRVRDEVIWWGGSRKRLGWMVQVRAAFRRLVQVSAGINDLGDGASPGTVGTIVRRGGPGHPPLMPTAARGDWAVPGWGGGSLRPAIGRRPAGAGFRIRRRPGQSPGRCIPR